MFLSDIFSQTLVNVTGVSVELYDTDGAKGAALGAGIGSRYFSKPKEAFTNMKKTGLIEPEASKSTLYEEIYANWKAYLDNKLEMNIY